MKQVLILSLPVLLFLSCTKFGKTVTLKGRVLNPITGEGIEGAEIWLQRSAGGIPGGNKTVKTAKSDSEGYFEVSKAGLRNYTAICVLDESYYKMGWQTDGTGQQNGDLQVENITIGKKKTIDYYATLLGKLKIELHNVNCTGPNDTLIYKREYISIQNVNVFQPFILTGCVDNPGAFAPVPSGDYKISWEVIRNGVSNSYSHILPVAANSQTSYIINY